jgi:hypothetical protein
MPCYQIITSEISFKIGNIEILKKALEKAKCNLVSEGKEQITFLDRYYNRIEVNFNSGKMIAAMNGKLLSELCNSIKRSYSEVVLDELAKRDHWIKKNMGQGKFQLQRF